MKTPARALACLLLASLTVLSLTGCQKAADPGSTAPGGTASVTGAPPPGAPGDSTSPAGSNDFSPAQGLTAPLDSNNSITTGSLQGSDNPADGSLPAARGSDNAAATSSNLLAGAVSTSGSGFDPLRALRGISAPAAAATRQGPAAPTRSAAAIPLPTRRSEAAPTSRTFKVWATAEGLIGGITASGVRIGKWMEGAALPSRKGLNKRLKVRYLANGRSSTAKVLDVGPWNINDAYWEKPGGRPAAESGWDQFGRRTNKAGIDLFNATWYKLLALRTYDRRLIENTSGMVEWHFVGQ